MTMAIAADDLRKRLLDGLAAEAVEVEDESARHAGHAGAREGGGHYRARIVSARFEGKSPVERHRLVYEALAGLVGGEIHALSMTLLTPAEARSPR